MEHSLYRDVYRKYYIDAMNVTATVFHREVNELERAGLTMVNGTSVDCPRIAPAPVSFECRRHIGIEIGTCGPQ